MRHVLILATLIVAAPANAAAPRVLNVATFMAKADALKAKGLLAMFSGDLKRLMGQIKTDATVLRQERVAAVSTGKQPAFCPPDKMKLNDEEIMAAMSAVPPGQRNRTSTRDALRSYLARRHPCRV